jgi:UDPglucose 6-dehydrogenase
VIRKKICIVGTGYVGMASAIGFAELGHIVTGYDIDIERVRGLQRGVTPYREAGIEEALRVNLAAGRITFHEELAAAGAGADYVVVAVGTPSLPNGSADLSAVHAAVEALVPVISEDAVIVLRSTVPVGTTDRLADAHDATFVYAPEFLREGSALHDFLNPDRIVIGAETDGEADGYAALLESLGRPTLPTTYRNAELIKGFSNAFLALKISFANEVANFCDAVDADALAVLRGVGHDRRIGTAFLTPGIGFGGPCFEKDVKALHHAAGQLNVRRELLAATMRVNAAQPQYILGMLEEELGGLAGTHIAVWGLAFKAGTDDVRDSIAVRIVNELVARGALVVAYDPAVAEAPPEIRCELRHSAMDAIEQADALLVLTEWDEFAGISPWSIAKRLVRGVVVDGRNILDPQAISATGLRYRGVGRRPTSGTQLEAAS